MANADNLKGKGFESRTTEELRQIASEAGKKSGEARRRKKQMKTEAKMLLEMPVSPAVKAKMRMMGIKDDNATYQMGILVAMLNQALGGNVKAANFFLELIGEDPKTELHKKEYKLKKEEFELRKEMAKSEENEGRSSFADMVVEAYAKRMEGNSNE